MRADQLRTGSHYGCKMPDGRLGVVEVRDFLPTGNILVRDVRHPTRRSYIMRPSKLWYEVVPAGDGSGRWQRLGNRTVITRETT
jgi:hypothetical protein